MKNKRAQSIINATDRCLIFGSSGQLGCALQEVFTEAIPIPRQQCDIADSNAVLSICEQYKPKVIINAAAYADVEKAETVDSLEAYRVNVIGAQTLARNAHLHKAKLVHISTDYVFDGRKDFFTEEGLPHPLNVHGLSKLASEYAVKAYCDKHYIFRTSALFGPLKEKPDNNFVAKRVAQIQSGDSISTVNDQWTVPTYTHDLAQAIAQILEKKIPYGTYHCVNSGGGVTWFGLTQEIVRILGANVSVTPINTSETNTTLQRPEKTILDTSKLESFGIVMPSLRTSLTTYIQKM